MSEVIFEHRIRSQKDLNFELDRVYANLDRASSWVTHFYDLYTEALATRNQKKIEKYIKEWRDSVKVRDEDRELIRKMKIFGESKGYVIDESTKKRLESRNL